MAAVIAAIVAAFLAGGIALLREMRLEKRRLRVAARVMNATIGRAKTAVVVTAKGSASWKALEVASGRQDVIRTWEDHRDVLAGHLDSSAWEEVQEAIRKFELIFLAEGDFKPSDSKWESPMRQLQDGLRTAQQALEPHCK